MNRRTFVQLAAGATLAQPLLTDALHATTSPTRFRFSVMLWTLEKQFPFERCVEIAAEAGYNGVQLVGEFQKWTAEDTQRIMSRIHSLGLVVDSMSGVRAGFSTTAETEIFISQFKDQLEAAKRLECPQVILLSGKREPELSPAAQTRTAVENLKRATDLAANDHIEIVIEPIDALENPTIFLQTVTDAFEIVGQVGRTNVKVLYDYQVAIAAGRMQLIQGKFSPLPWIDCTFDKVLIVNAAYFFDRQGEDAAEAFRVLKPGGRLVVYVTARETMEKWPFAGPDTHGTYDSVGLRLLLETAGFERADIRIQTVTLPLGVRGLLAIAEKSFSPHVIKLIR
ncbi:MAG: TIM barrel protein [Terracidiphilus sp.]